MSTSSFPRRPGSDRFRIIAETTTTTTTGKVGEHEEEEGATCGARRSEKGGGRGQISERCPSLSLSISHRDNTLWPIRGTPNDRWKLPALAAARATRPDPTRALLAAVLWRHRLFSRAGSLLARSLARTLSLSPPPLLLSTPRTPAVIRPRTIEDERIAADRRRWRQRQRPRVPFVPRAQPLRSFVYVAYVYVRARVHAAWIHVRAS